MSGKADPRPRVWITRAQPGAAATALRVTAQGWEPVTAPVLETRPIEGASLDLAGIDAIAFTSAAGVRAFAALSPERALPVFAVGAATAAAAREAGFAHTANAEGDAYALAARIAAAEPRPLRLLHPGALEPAADLGRLLATARVAVTTAAVYASADTHLPAAPDDLGAVLVHSPRGGEIAGRLLAGAELSRTALVAISAAAAQPLASLAFARARIARTPDETALLEALEAVR